MDLSRRSVLAAPSVLLAQSSSNEFRVAYIGVGNRGSYTMRQLMKVPGVKVVAVSDLDPERMKAAIDYVQSQGGQAAGFADYRKMLESRKDIDAVVIATPVDTHKNIAIAALELGKHVYLEKPVGVTVEECDLVEKASRSAKGILQVGFQLRHDPNRAASMKFIKDGGIGKVLYCHGMRHTGDLPHNTPWLFDRKRSGDIIVEQACHILDLFVWAIGAAPLRAMGSGGINLFKDVPPGRSVMDNWSAIWEFPNDVRVNFSQIYFDPAGFSGINERVFGSTAAIDLAKAQWGEVAKKGELHTLEVPPATERADYFAMEAFVNASRSRSTPLNSIQSANLSTKAAILGRMAIERKRVVTWSELS
jgi:myo-inositol 2-dehydrogenase/D-chiro-inositol 1-dehydrogenase